MQISLIMKFSRWINIMLFIKCCLNIHFFAMTIISLLWCFFCLEKYLCFIQVLFKSFMLMIYAWLCKVWLAFTTFVFLNSYLIHDDIVFDYVCGKSLLKAYGKHYCFQQQNQVVLQYFINKMIQSSFFNLSISLIFINKMQMDYKNSILILQCSMPCKFNTSKCNQQLITPAQLRQRIQLQKTIQNIKFQQISGSQPKNTKTTTSVDCKRSLKKKYLPKHDVKQKYIQNTQKPLKTIQNTQFKEKNTNKSPPLLKYQKTFKKFNTPALVHQISTQSLFSKPLAFNNQQILFQSPLHNTITKEKEKKYEYSNNNKIASYSINLYVNNNTKDKNMHTIRSPLIPVSLNSSQRRLKKITSTESDELSIYEPNVQQFLQINNNNVVKASYYNTQKIDKPVIIQKGFDNFFDSQFHQQLKFKNGKNNQNKQQNSINKESTHKRILGNCLVRRVQSIVDSNPEIQYSHVIPCSKITIKTNQRSNDNINNFQQPKIHSILTKQSRKHSPEIYK